MYAPLPPDSAPFSLSLGTTRSTTRLPVLTRGVLPVALARADRAEFRRRCPARPGVYAMLDARGVILYVGKSRCLRARLAAYLRADDYGDKAFRILAAAETLIWEELPDEFATLYREIELIKLWQPRYNVQYHPARRRYGYLVLTAGEAPRFVVRPSRPERGAVLAAVGPLPAKRRLRDAAEALNDLFRLRTCAGEGDLPLARPGCMRADLGTCLAPCMTIRQGQAEYAAAVQAGRGFLTGRDVSLVPRLRSAMTAAAEALNFEMAALHRDRLALLLWLRRRVRDVARARRRYNFVYRPKCADGSGESWYLVRRGKVEAALAAPESPAAGARAAALLERVFAGEKQRLAEDQDGDGIAMVVAWFRERPEELLRTMAPAEARSALEPFLAGACRPTI